MFTLAEKKAIHGKNSAVLTSSSSNVFDTQELGALGVSNTDFKKVVEILSNRSNSLYFPIESGKLRNIISTNPTQKSLMIYLGSKKKTGAGVTGQISTSTPNTTSSSAGNLAVSDLTSGGGLDGSKKHVSDNKNNLLNKLEAEEVALKRLAYIFSKSQASKDNPLKDDKEAIPSENVWEKLSEKNLEYIFRECITMDVTNDGSVVRQGRYLRKEEVGDNPYLMTIHINIRILQRMLLNFPWFCNRFFRVVSGLGIETTASSNVTVALDDNMSNVWGDVMVKSCIREDVMTKCLQFLKDQYPCVYEEIRISPRGKPTHFIVEFDKIDNGVGLALTEEEHRGFSYMEWRCFNSIRKTQQNDGISAAGGNNNNGGSRLDALLGNKSVHDVSPHNISAAAADILNFSKNGTSNDGGSLFAGSSFVSENDDAWMRGILEAACSPHGNGRVGTGVNQSTYERFRSGEGTASVAESATINFSPLTKGEEGRQFVLGMIYFINKSLNDIENPLMCEDKNIFGEDQLEQYNTYKELFTAAVCSNPANIYRVVCDLFVNLVLPRLRNPVANQIENVQTVTAGNGQQKSRIITEYGCVDTQYNNTPPHARGKVRISARRGCECRKSCKETKCFDSNRKNNQPSHMRTAEKTEEPAFKRNHNSHRSNAHDFRFFDILQCNMNKLKSEGKKKSNKNKKTRLTTDYDFLLQDRTAFDLLKSCFLSAGLHHIYCPDIFMVHRGDNFNINLQNNKLEGFNESNGVEEVTSSQIVNAKEALQDITKNHLRRDDSVFEYMQQHNMSLRDFSAKASKVIRQLNALTSELCNTCNDPSLSTIKVMICIGTYVFNILPLLEMLLVFVNNEELQSKVEACRAMTQPNMPCDKVVSRPKCFGVYFSLFDYVVKLLLRNYNASVASAYNRRGYISSISNIIGYRFSNNGDGIKYHETIVSVNSCISYADYFSTRGGGHNEAITQTDTTNIDRTIATMTEQFNSEGKDTECENNVIKMYASHVLNSSDSDDSDSDSESETSSSTATPPQLNTTETTKRKISDTKNEEEEEQQQQHERKDDVEKQEEEGELQTEEREPQEKKVKMSHTSTDDSDDERLF